MKTLLLLFAVASLALTGCTHVISPEGRALADPALSIATIRANPAAHTGKTLLFGGLIVAALADSDGTVLELIPWDLDFFGEPVAYSADAGHFFVVSELCLDSNDFAPGRLVTVSATVNGRQRPIPGDNRLGPELRLAELHLWDTPYRYGQSPGIDPYQPDCVPAWHERDNPYDPGYAPYPFVPTDIPR